jgi:hypothetical protein
MSRRASIRKRQRQRKKYAQRPQPQNADPKAVGVLSRVANALVIADAMPKVTAEPLPPQPFAGTLQRLIVSRGGK